jgi:PAS domain S-box-containing protein
MELEIQNEWELPHFDNASLRVEGYVWLGLYVLLLLFLLILRRQDFRALTGRRGIIFFFLLLLAIPFNNLLWLRFPATGVLPPPAVPTAPPSPSLPLLGMLPILLAGALFGAGPALVVGFIAGLARGSGLDSSRLFTPAELAVVGMLVGFLLRQTYRGYDWRLLRQPLAAALVSAVCHWVLLWMGVFTTTRGSGMSAFDYTRSLMVASIGAVVLDSLLSGLFVQGLVLLVPGIKPAITGDLMPPHLRSMNRRLLTAFIPLTMLMMVAMFSAVTTAAIREATHQAVSGMERGANNAAQMIPHFFNTGQELLSRVAAAEPLRSPNAEVRQQALIADFQVGIYGPFFSQFLVFDAQQNLLNAYPDQGLPVSLLPEEQTLLQRTLGFGSPEHSPVLNMGGQYVISFIVPIGDNNGQLWGALVGRSFLDINPTINQILSALQWLENTGSGLVVDDREMVAFHPDADRMLQEWKINLDCAAVIQTASEGRVCQDLDYDGTRRLIFYLPVTAMQGWTVVVTYPYEQVLDRATRISGPLLIILLVATGVVAITVPWMTGRLTRPLQMLATAAFSIAQGQLDNHVDVMGEDEVGQLGDAFERMRQSLKGRLDDLSLLLRVSQAVSSSLDVTQSLPPILEGALQATAARFARLVLLDEQGEPLDVIARGSEGGYVTALDRAIVRLSKKSGPLRIENTSRSRGMIDPGLLGQDIRALLAAPMRSKDHLVGIMWLAYSEAHTLGSTEVDFITTLASQAAVAVENARLFQVAEGGRRRLAAILESTSDVVIVTDRANHVLLLNPAAADVFAVDAQAATGLSIDEAVHEEIVIRLLTAPIDNGAPLTGEVPLPDGRTFYASASAIVSGDGQAIGRVAVLRDITYLKEVDEMKSEFVATVSHDLRAPLTFMRGYATMIPMVDQISPKQKAYVDKILLGIEQMTELIDDLLDLGRIEAGVGLVRELCRLDEIIVAQVDTMRPRATAQGLTLRMDRTEDVTLVMGDAALLRRLIANLLDNAIKYTPQGGQVAVGWETRGNRVLISVADTGIGIAKKDQARLFEKFSRVKRRETINIKGSGLGLAIVKSIAERHAGRVWVESELDQGSTFYVEIPAGALD